ncbi:Uncharacterised protein [Mycobacteroides abscessus subsp. abscessus]|nr:Uncharacterised protein [Mycobacteroides abscessus subsp. abscessus]
MDTIQVPHKTSPAPAGLVVTARARPNQPPVCGVLPAMITPRISAMNAVGSSHAM